MTQTKPPEHEWIDFLIGQTEVAANFDPSEYQFPRSAQPGDSQTACASIPKAEIIKRARAELAQLRANSAAYLEAMRLLSIYADNHYMCKCDTCSLVKREREAGRFTP